MTAELTPFERAELGLVNSSILVAVAGCTVETMQLLTECNAQVDMYKTLLLEGAEIDDDAVMTIEVDIERVSIDE